MDDLEPSRGDEASDWSLEGSLKGLNGSLVPLLDGRVWGECEPDVPGREGGGSTVSIGGKYSGVVIFENERGLLFAFPKERHSGVVRGLAAGGNTVRSVRQL